MYNLYIHKKKLFENEKKEINDFFQDEFKRKRKQELDKLSKNYDNRMKNFIFSLCEKPIILGKKINNEEKNKTYSKANFKFGGFKTDKQRLEIIQEYNDKIKYYEQKRKKIEKRRNILKIKNHQDYVLIQPEMRFSSKTKLEKIIEKIKNDFIVNENIFDLNRLEKIKKLKNNGIKKIKEFYNLIDKDDLKDLDIQNIIEKYNSLDQDDLNNQYSLKNYIAWKYNNNIIYNKINAKTDNKFLKNIDKLNFENKVGHKTTQNKLQNEYEILVKNDFKTHFKGATQYVELLNLKGENENKLRPKIISNKRVISSKSLRNDNNNNLNKFFYKENKKYKSSRNKKFSTIKNMKRPVSVINFEDNKESQNNLLKNKTFKKENNFNENIQDFKKKKNRMIYLMNKEINESILDEFKKKYNSIQILNNSGNIDFQKHGILFKYNDFTEKKKEENLKEKFENLTNIIDEEKRKTNNERYKKFEKKLSRSIFDFKSKEMQKKIEEIENYNKKDYVILDGKAYKKDEIKKITKILFCKCNYYNKIKE